MLYLRLSKEDKDKGDESRSISNKRAIAEIGVVKTELRQRHLREEYAILSSLTIQTLTAEKDDIQVNRRDALRYMGCAGASPNEELIKLMDECERELLQAAHGKCCYAHCTPIFPEENVTDLGFGSINSTLLYRHTKSCTGVILFAATIGIDVDRLIAKYGRLSPSKSLVIDGLASSAIEYWCDRAQEKLTPPNSKSTRVSAGYGDFPLLCQKEFIKCLYMTRTLGITLSETLLMTPTKSVTAVIGIKPIEDVK